MLVKDERYIQDCIQCIRRRFEDSAVEVTVVDKEDLDMPNHLSGKLRRCSSVPMPFRLHFYYYLRCCTCSVAVVEHALLWTGWLSGAGQSLRDKRNSRTAFRATVGVSRRVIWKNVVCPRLEAFLVCENLRGLRLSGSAAHQRRFAPKYLRLCVRLARRSHSDWQPCRCWSESSACWGAIDTLHRPAAVAEAAPPPKTCLTRTFSSPSPPMVASRPGGLERHRFLKLSFHSVSDLMEVKKALMPTIKANKARADAQDAYMHAEDQQQQQQHQPDDFLSVLVDAREYDVPYYVRCSIDLDIRYVVDIRGRVRAACVSGLTGGAEKEEAGKKAGG